MELYNLTDQPIDLSGWYLSDTAADPKRYRIPQGTVLPPRGYLVVYQAEFGSTEGERDEPPRFSFNSARGDEVHLFEATLTGELTGYRASASFGPAPNGVPWGLHSTSVGFDLTLLTRPTFGVDQPTNLVHFRSGRGASNAPPRIGPVVINEIQYQPVDEADGVDTGPLEFIELYNLAPTNVPLFDPAHPTNRWRLANAVRFEFPPDLVLPPGGYLLIVPFAPETQPTLRQRFESRYGPVSCPILGPYEGRLDNAGETVELLRPDTPQAPPHPDAGYVPYYLVDRVGYLPHDPWPATAAGGGASLQRLQPHLYGNDPAHWKAEPPTPGRTNAAVAQEPPVILQPPASLTVVLGQIASFAVECHGTPPLTFQWYHEGTALPGATNPVLEVVVDSTNRAGLYRVRVSNAFGNVLSSPASLTVWVPPHIVVAPSDRVARIGEEVTWTVQATGTTPLSYQWQRENVDLPGETSATLRLPAVAPAHAGLYRVLVTNVAGSTSAVARLIVVAPPLITAQPRSGFALLGSRFELRVAATGDPPLSYQWFHEGRALPGATSPVLVLDPVERAHTGSYAVRVQNPVDSIWSETARVEVVAPPQLVGLGWTEEGDFEGLLIGEAGRVYAIEVSPDLLHWRELGRWRLSASSATFSDGEALRQPVRYYRARLVE